MGSSLRPGFPSQQQPEPGVDALEAELQRAGIRPAQPPGVDALEAELKAAGISPEVPTRAPSREIQTEQLRPGVVDWGPEARAVETHRERYGVAPATVVSEPGAQITVGQPVPIGIPRDEVERLVKDRSLATRVNTRLQLLSAPAGHVFTPEAPDFGDLLVHTFMAQTASPFAGGGSDVSTEAQMERYVEGGGAFDAWQADVLGAIAASGAVVGNVLMGKGLGYGGRAVSPATSTAARLGAKGATEAMRQGAIKALQDEAVRRQVHPTLIARLVDNARRAMLARAPLAGELAIEGATQGVAGAAIGGGVALAEGADAGEVARRAIEEGLVFSALGMAFHGLSVEQQFQLGYRTARDRLRRNEAFRRTMEREAPDRTAGVELVHEELPPGDALGPAGAAPRTEPMSRGTRVELEPDPEVAAARASESVVPPEPARPAAPEARQGTEMLTDVDRAYLAKIDAQDLSSFDKERLKREYLQKVAETEAELQAVGIEPTPPAPAASAEVVEPTPPAEVPAATPPKPPAERKVTPQIPPPGDGGYVLPSFVTDPYKGKGQPPKPAEEVVEAEIEEPREVVEPEVPTIQVTGKTVPRESETGMDPSWGDPTKVTEADLHQAYRDGLTDAIAAERTGDRIENPYSLPVSRELPQWERIEAVNRQKAELFDKAVRDLEEASPTRRLQILVDHANQPDPDGEAGMLVMDAVNDFMEDGTPIVDTLRRWEVTVTPDVERAAHAIETTRGKKKPAAVEPPKPPAKPPLRLEKGQTPEYPSGFLSGYGLLEGDAAEAQRQGVGLTPDEELEWAVGEGKISQTEADRMRAWRDYNRWRVAPDQAAGRRRGDDVATFDEWLIDTGGREYAAEILGREPVDRAPPEITGDRPEHDPARVPSDTVPTSEQATSTVAPVEKPVDTVEKRAEERPFEREEPDAERDVRTGVSGEPEGAPPSRIPPAEGDRDVERGDRGGAGAGAGGVRDRTGGAPPAAPGPEGLSESGAAPPGAGEPGPRVGPRGDRGAAGPGERGPRSEPERPERTRDTAADDRAIVERERGRDYELTPAIAADLISGGQKTKATRNLAAIELLKSLETDGRIPTRAEQDVLAKYTGWGGIPQIFLSTKEAAAYRAGTLDTEADQYKKWRSLGGPALLDALTPEEYNAARASTPNAHYTSPEVVKATHDVLTRLGFTGGRILEPSMGAGYFLGMTPAAHRERYRWTGVELDSITGRIGKMLYPESDIRVQGYEKLQLPDGYFDAAIGNVPFGDYTVNDPRYNALKLSIHNYFFRKTLDMVRPGGLVAFITSRFTLDAVDSAVRKALAEHANFVGAIRLPQTAFRGVANTDVVTDLIVLQVRAKGEPPGAEPWLETRDISHLVGAHGKAKPVVNQYFADHPSMTLGTYSLAGTMYGEYGLTVEADTGSPLAEQLRSAIARLPAGVYEARKPSTSVDPEVDVPVITADPSIKEGALIVQGGKVLQRRNGVLADAGVPAGHVERIRQLIELRSLVAETLKADIENAAEEVIDAARAKLVKAYDAFHKTYGPINKEVRTEVKNPKEPDNPRIQVRTPNLLYFDDVERGLVAALEEYDSETGKATKGDLLLRRVFPPRKLAERVGSPVEALPIVLAESGRVDLARIAQLAGTDEGSARIALRGVVFEDPKQPGTLLHGDLYLTGDVKAKLAEARLAAEKDPARWKGNVTALEQVQPADLPPSQISVRLGAAWVPTTDIEDWINEILGTRKGQVEVRYTPATRYHLTVGWGVKSSFAATNEWGTLKADATELIRDALNLKSTTVYLPPDSEGKTAKDVEATLAAQEKQQKLKDHFSEWVWKDGARATRLARLYNDEFNRIRDYRPDGSHLQLPGAAAYVRGKPFSFFPHQKNAIWRFLTHDPELGNTGLFHVVGSGKTYTMVAMAMEAKRLGLARKPMQIVPNHMLEQFSREAKQLYPTARVLLATKEDFAAKERQAFIARAAANDWDLIIMTQRSFESIPMSAEFRAKYMEAQLAELEQTIIEAKADKAPRSLIKQIERAKKDLEARIEKMTAEGKKDAPLSFEQMGVDLLFVDEADNYKNLYFATKMEGVAAPNSQRAFDLFLKSIYLDNINPGRALVFATGTPIANQVAEMFTMQRYLQRRLLEARGLSRFDDWAGAFGETVTSMELKPDNSGFRTKTRFARYTNMGELAQMFRAVADVQTADDLKLPRPALRGGQSQVISVKATGELKAYIKELAARGERVQAKQVDPTVDNWLKITSDGRHAALDMRLVDASALDLPDSKLNRAVQQIHEVWKATAKYKGTQLVFSDLSTPGSDAGTRGGVPGFNVYEDIKAKLIKAGIPKAEVRFIHDAKTDEQKKKLFADVRAGRVRVLLGSTEKMGAGTNVQDKIVALHHLDAPWRPRDIEQRNGRALRQGNQIVKSSSLPNAPLDFIDIFNYVTEGSFDGYIWQGLERKAGFITQAIKADASTRAIEDVDTVEVDWATVKAIASGNPKVREKAEVDAQITRLEKLQRAHADQQFAVRQELATLPGRVQELTQKAQSLMADAKRAEPTAGDAFKITIAGTEISDRTAAGEALHALVAEARLAATKLLRGNDGMKDLGTFAGFDLALTYGKRAISDAVDVFYRLRGEGVHFRELGDEDSALSLVMQLEHMPGKLVKELAETEALLERQQKRLSDLQEKGKTRFQHLDKLNELRQKAVKLEKELSEVAKEPIPGLPPTPRPGEEPDVDDFDEGAGETGRPAGFGRRDPLRHPHAPVPFPSTMGRGYGSPIGPSLSGDVVRSIPKGKDVSAPEIMRALADVTEAAGKRIDLRIGRMGGRRYAGVWNTRTQVIRTLQANDMATGAHEVAHALESLLYGDLPGSAWVKPRATPAMQRQLVALGRALYGSSRPAAGYKREGWAEFTRIWLTESDNAGGPQSPYAAAPLVHAWFETTFKKDHPEVWTALEAAREKIRTWRRQGARARFESALVDPGTIGERVKRAVAGIRSFLSFEKWIDMAEPLRTVATEAEQASGRAIDASDDPFRIMEALRTTHTARTRVMVEDYMIDVAGNRVGPSLNEIRPLVQGRQLDFMIYLYAKRTLALLDDPQGQRASGMSRADAEQVIKELDSPTFQVAAGKVYAWSEGTMDYAAEASPTFAEVVNAVRKRDPGNYVPLQRVFDDLDDAWAQTNLRAGGASHRSPVKRLKGSMRRVKDPFPVMIAQTERLIRQAHERMVLDAIIRLSGIKGMGHLIEEVPPDERPAAAATVEEILRRLQKEAGITADPASVNPAVLANTMVFFAPVERPSGKDPIVPIYDQGKVRWFYVDAQLYDTLRALDVYRLKDVAGLPILEWIAGKPTAVFRAGTTGLRASFGLLWNPLRDFQVFYVNTRSRKAGAILFAQWLRGLVEMGLYRSVGIKSEWVDVYTRLGIEMAQPLGQDIPHTRRAARALFQTPIRRYTDLRNWYDWFRDFVQFPEGAGRIAEIRLLAKEIGWAPGQPMTLDQSLELLTAGKQVTTDFTAVGEFARVMNRIAPFHNSAIQGPRASIRAAKRNPALFAWRVFQIAALTLLAWWQLKDEVWYRVMDARERFLHWHFKIRWNGRDEVIRIPRAFEVGMIGAALPEMMMDAWYRDDPEQVKLWFKTLFDVTTPNIEPVLLKVAREQWQNQQWPEDRPIVPRSVEQKPEPEQFTDYTSRASIEIGRVFGISPLRVDHAIRGTLGPVALDVLLGLGGQADDLEHETTLADTPILGRAVVRGGPLGLQPRPIRELYDVVDEILKHQHSDADPETREERRIRLQMVDAVNAVSGLLGTRRFTKKEDDRRALTARALAIAEDALKAYDAGEFRRGPFKRAAARAGAERERLERQRRKQDTATTRP